MIGLALDSNNDIYVLDGQFARSEGIYNVAQNVKTRVNLFQGELFFNTDAGVPYISDILGKSKDYGRISSVFREVIENTPLVDKILTLDMSLDNSTRKLNVKSTVEAVSTQSDEISILTKSI